MRITERQARQRLARAVEEAGGQTAYARTLPGTPVKNGQTYVSRALAGTRPVETVLLTALGLRRDNAGDVHTVEPAPSRLSIVAVHAEGEAAVSAAAALVSRILTRS